MKSNLRKQLVELHYKSGAVHLGSSLSCLDILETLILKKSIPHKDVILSKGHAASALYVVLNELGVLSDNELNTYYQDHSKLLAHPTHHSSLVDFGTGSLGHGLSLAAGKCMARKLTGNPNKIFVVLSDGEMNEGAVYEAINFAIQHQLNNLVIIVDNNGLQGLGKSEDVLGDLTESFKSRDRLSYYAVDGHDLDELERLIALPSGYPLFINAKTIKGKGLDFAEGNNDWHYKQMSSSDYQKAIAQL